MAVSNLLMGPSKTLGFPNKQWIFFIGYGMNGFSQGMLFTPILPEIIDAVYQARGIIEGENDDIDGVIGDKGAGLYLSFFSLGTITAPLIGSAVYAAFKDDWFYTCDFFAAVGCVWIILFLFANVLPDIRRER